jgi:membrane-bound lytic murein transglycosylase B
MLGVWGIESAFGDPIVAKNYMRPVIPSLAALAWCERRRRTYWEQELINALTIVQNGWSTPDEMVGSWAGAMGHTMDARSLAAHGHRLQSRWQGFALRPAG